VSGLKRAALVFGILALLLFADGGYLLATHRDPNGDTGTLFGNSHYYLSAGTVVVMSGFLVLVASVVMWLLAVVREDRQRLSAGHPPTRERPQAGDPATPEQPSAGDPTTREQPGPSGRTATRA
jgi:hypothetical protein